MIRIETTAEFDADGRFTGRTTEPITPGAHRIVLVVDEAESTAAPDESDSDAVQRIDGQLVFVGKLLEDPEEVRKRLDEERARQLFEGPYE